MLAVYRAGTRTRLVMGGKGGGGAERDRTADLVNAIHALSQLSYSPMRALRAELRIRKSEAGWDRLHVFFKSPVPCFIPISAFKLLSSTSAKMS